VGTAHTGTAVGTGGTAQWEQHTQVKGGTAQWEPHTQVRQLVQEEQHSGHSTHRYSSWYRRGSTVGTAHTGTAVGNSKVRQVSRF
jgi:hypothetical protein